EWMRTSGRGVLSITELLKRPEFVDSLRGRVLIGIADHPYFGLASHLRMVPYDDFYRRQGWMLGDDHLDDFMEIATSNQNIFLIPRNFLNYKIDPSQSD